MMGGLHIVVMPHQLVSVQIPIQTHQAKVLHEAISTIDSFLNILHRKKMRNACQISALALAIPQDKTFSQTNDSFN